MTPTSNPFKGLHCLIAGRVQGVFFRANTKRKAIELGVTGWVRNLADGRVEVLAFGNAEQLAVFESWLAQGTPPARVDTLDTNLVEWQEVTDFTVK